VPQPNIISIARSRRATATPRSRVSTGTAVGGGAATVRSTATNEDGADADEDGPSPGESPPDSRPQSPENGQATVVTAAAETQNGAETAIYVTPTKASKPDLAIGNESPILRPAEVDVTSPVTVSTSVASPTASTGGALTRAASGTSVSTADGMPASSDAGVPGAPNGSQSLGRAVSVGSTGSPPSVVPSVASSHSLSRSQATGTSRSHADVNVNHSIIHSAAASKG
jgi:hypothetical protein